MDLTAVPDSETWRRHFADSLYLLGLEDFEGKRVIDIGSGAGFPGIPLKIACPGMSLTLVDAKEKRVEFLREAAARIGIEVQAIHGRAEELATKSDFREGFDAAVSRAVAKMSVLGELSLPFVEVGGVFLAHKGKEAEKELEEAEKAIITLGGKVEKIEKYEFGKIVVIRKVAATPEKYPRKWKKIERGFE